MRDIRNEILNILDMSPKSFRQIIQELGIEGGGKRMNGFTSVWEEMVAREDKFIGREIKEVPSEGAELDMSRDKTKKSGEGRVYFRIDQEQELVTEGILSRKKSVEKLEGGENLLNLFADMADLGDGERERIRIGIRRERY